MEVVGSHLFLSIFFNINIFLAFSNIFFTAAKDKLSTRFQPQSLLVSASSGVKNFSMSRAADSGPVQASFKMLAKKARSRSLDLTQLDTTEQARTQIRQTADEKIAAFEKFITEDFDKHNNTRRSILRLQLTDEVSSEF